MDSDLTHSTTAVLSQLYAIYVLRLRHGKRYGIRYKATLQYEYGKHYKATLQYEYEKHYKATIEV